MSLPRLAAWTATLSAVGLLAACGDGAAPPDSADGAAGVVQSGNAAASQDPVATGSLSGGPSGQTPAYGQAGGAPSAVTESGDGAGASIGSDNSPTGGEGRGSDADQQTVPK